MTLSQFYYYTLIPSLSIGSYPVQPLTQFNAILNVSRENHTLFGLTTTYRHNPFHHLETTGIDELRQAMLWLYSHHYMMNKNTLIHCRLGQDRSFAIATAYLWLLGNSLDNALSMMSNLRPNHIPSPRDDIFEFLFRTCTPMFKETLQL